MESAGQASSAGLAAYLDRVESQLRADGFSVSRPASGPYALEADRSRIELTKFGNVDTGVHVAHLGSLTSTELRAFSAMAFAATVAKPRGFRMPRGLGQGVFSYAVAVVDEMDEPLATFVRQTAAPKHWSAFEWWAVYDLSTSSLHVLESTPLWGAAYIATERSRIKRLFG